MSNNGEININNATILKQSDESENEPSQKISDEEHEYITNLDDTKTVNVQDTIKNDVEEEVKIDFMKEDFSTSFTASKSKKSTAKPAEEKEYTTEQIQEEIKQAESHADESMSPDTFKDIAGFLVFLIDTGFSTGMKIWTGDSSDEPYSLSKPKQTVLINQLTRILIKYQAKFKIEFMFIATIVVLYIPGIIKARQNKKLIKAASNIPVVKRESNYKTQKSVIDDIMQTAEVKPLIVNTPKFENEDSNIEIKHNNATPQETLEEISVKLSGVPKRTYRKNIRKPGGRKKL